MLPIMHTLNRGGSGTGYHYYTSFLNCPKKAQLQMDQPTESSLPLEVGTLGHAFMELHFNRELEDSSEVAVQFSNTTNELARIEAERAFRFFRMEYPELDIFGTVKAVEYGIDSTEHPNVIKEVGIHPYTCRIDLITEINKEQIERLKQRFEVLGVVEALRPGPVIIDHKFFARFQPIMVDKALHNMQFTSYYQALKGAGMEATCIIQNMVFKGRNPEVKLVVIPAPGSSQVKVLHHMYKRVEMIVNEQFDMCNPNACFDYNSTCPYLISGDCRRY